MQIKPSPRRNNKQSSSNINPQPPTIKIPKNNNHTSWEFAFNEYKLKQQSDSKIIYRKKVDSRVEKD